MWEFEPHDGAIPSPMPKLIATAVTKVVRTAGVRTRTGSPPQDFKSCVSTSSTTSARRDRWEATVPEILSPGNAIHGEDQLRVLKGSGLIRLL